MKRLLILSGKGGTGKTTTAAAFIRFSGARAMADCDVDAPNLHLVAGMNSEPVKSNFMGADKASILAERCIGCGTCMEACRFHSIFREDGICRINEYACEGCGVCAYVCPNDAVILSPDVAGHLELYKDDRVFSTARLKMGRGNSGKLVTAVKMELLKNAPDTDLAVIDGSPGIGCPVIASVSGMDLVLVVAEPSLSGISDLIRLVRTTQTFRTKLAVCVNKWDSGKEHTETIRQFCEEETIPFAGLIPYDPTVSKAVNEGKSIAEYDCPASRALYEVYQNTVQLLNES